MKRCIQKISDEIDLGIDDSDLYSYDIIDTHSRAMPGSKVYGRDDKEACQLPACRVQGKAVLKRI